MTYPSFESFYSRVMNTLTWSVWSLCIPLVKLGCIWSDVLGFLVNVNGWVNEIRNIGRRCKILLLSYFTEIWRNINSTFLTVDAKLTKRAKQLCVPLYTNMATM
jgi:hypothetical protein